MSVINRCFRHPVWLRGGSAGNGEAWSRLGIAIPATMAPQLDECESVAFEFTGDFHEACSLWRKVCC